jgi:RNA polymerase sigma-70 factor (ECF subfamily)
MSPATFTAPEDLLTRARGGCGTSWGQLLDRYANYLALLARVEVGRRLQGKADPADLVQETFLQAHRHLPQFRGTTEGEFLAWLRSILASRIVKFLRRYLGTRARDVRLERQIEEDLDRSSRCLAGGLYSPAESPSAQASRREQAVRLADALAGLPPRYREVLVLRSLEGLAFKAVAERLGETEDSVQKLWVRGLQTLRVSLEVPR